MSRIELGTLSSSSFKLEPVFTIRVELGPEDDDRIRWELSEKIGLAYGDYDHVSLETAAGVQYFRGRLGTASGTMEKATSRQVRALMFSIPREESVLKSSLEIIHHLHSYEEPVVYVTEAFATRAKTDAQDSNPHKWWNSQPSMRQ